jgi:hypothetical protein
MSIYPVIRENVTTGSIGRYVHAFSTETKSTLCGIDAYAGPPSVQLSVEPEGTKVTCLRCQSALQPDPSRRQFSDFTGIEL